MCPVAQTEGHDAPGLVDKLVPSVAAVVDEVVVAGEDAVREPVVPHELPDVLLRVQLGTLRGQGHEGDVRRHGEPGRGVPPGPVDQQRRMPPCCDLLRDGGQVQGHRLGVAAGQDEARGLALLGADGAEDVGRGGALVPWRHGPGAAPRPAPGQLVFLADAGLVAEPDFYVTGIDARLARDRVQAGGKAFLKASMAPSACAWWRGRAESLR